MFVLSGVNLGGVKCSLWFVQSLNCEKLAGGKGG